MSKYLAAFVGFGAASAHAHSDGMLHSLSHGFSAEQLVSLAFFVGLGVVLRTFRQRLARHTQHDVR